MNAIEKLVAQADWDCTGAPTRYLTHGIHRYSGKFIPQIAAQAVELLSRPGDTIVDPYCGSGTTLLEAALRGRRSVGADLNPLAVLIAKVKTTPVPVSRLAALTSDLLSRLDGVGQQTALWSVGGAQVAPIAATTSPLCGDEWSRKWFAPAALMELRLLKHKIGEIEDKDLQDVALVAFSDILRRSSNAHQGYPNVMYDARRGTAPSPIGLFRRRLTTIARSLAEIGGAFANEVIPAVRLESAQRLSLDDGAAAAIITHPPYVGSVPYAEYWALSLCWLGHDPRELDRRLTGGQRQRRDVVERFERDFDAMVTEAARVVRPGGGLFMMLGFPMVRGERIDLPTMALDLAADAGFTQTASATRQGSNRRANKMANEVLLFLRRPRRSTRRATGPAA